MTAGLPKACSAEPGDDHPLLARGKSHSVRGWPEAPLSNWRTPQSTPSRHPCHMTGSEAPSSESQTDSLTVRRGSSANQTATPLPGPPLAQLLGTAFPSLKEITPCSGPQYCQLPRWRDADSFSHVASEVDEERKGRKEWVLAGPRSDCKQS